MPPVVSLSGECGGGGFSGSAFHNAELHREQPQPVNILEGGAITPKDVSKTPLTFRQESLKSSQSGLNSSHHRVTSKIEEVTSKIEES